MSLLFINKGNKRLNYIEQDAVSIIWNEILEQYAQEDNNNLIIDKISKQIYILQLQNAYTTVLSMIKLLSICTPSNSNKEMRELALEYVRELKLMGHVVSLKNSKEYGESLVRASKKNKALLTIINKKKYELEERYGKDPNEAEDNKPNIDFDELYIMVSSEFNLSEDLTVKRYLSAKKIITKRNKLRSNANKGGSHKQGNIAGYQ